MCSGRKVPDLPTRLLQGEILRNVVEYLPTGAVDDEGNTEILGVVHPLIVVLTPACDLVSDYEERGKLAPSVGTAQGGLNPKLLPHTQCCDLFLSDEIRYPFGFNSGTWRVATRNRDERYHRVPAEGIDNFDHPDLFLDFKRIISVPTEHLYLKLSDGSIERCGEVREPWLYQLVQRCYGYQARVCLPDPSDLRPSAQN